MPTPMPHPRGDFEEVPAVPKGRNATVSVALPSSILANAQSAELRIYLAGQIARAAAIFCIDELVIFDEQPDTHHQPTRDNRASRDNADHTAFFKLILEYLETPQYLRRHLFPVSQDLRLVGLLNPLALPSHVSRSDCSRWREGIAVGRVVKGARGSTPPTRYVDVGLQRLVEVDRSIPVGERVTVDMAPSGSTYDACPGKYLFGKLVDRSEPRLVDGLYWGYRVRTAACLSDIFEGSAVTKSYDLTVGTSERGTPIVGRQSAGFALPDFSHLLLVFGGVQGLERSVQGDKKLEVLGISSPSSAGGVNSGTSNIGDLFDFYVNTCPEQGSRTIRSEEALLISLAALQPHMRPRS